jgi:hypothetical protein
MSEIFHTVVLQDPLELGNEIPIGEKTERGRAKIKAPHIFISFLYFNAQFFLVGRFKSTI